MIRRVLTWIFRMDNDRWASVFHDAGIAIMTIGATAAYSGDISNAIVGLVGGFIIIRIGHSIRT